MDAVLHGIVVAVTFCSAQAMKIQEVLRRLEHA